MPSKGWATLSVREEVKKQLEELASKLGMSSPNDVVAYLLDKYREFTEISVRLERLLTDLSVKLTDISVKLEKYSANTPAMSTSSKSPVASNSSSTETVTKGKMTAFERFMMDGYVFFSDLARSRSVRFPEKLYEAIKRSALGNKVRLVEVKTDEDSVLLKAEKWEEFKKKLAEVKSPDEREVFSVLRDEWLRKLFTILSKAGAIYFHSKSKNWEFDYSFIKELEESSSSPTAVGDVEL